MPMRLTRTRRFLYLIEALPVYAFFGLMRLMPLRVASAVGGAIGRGIGPRLPFSRRARQNLERYLPEASAADRNRILREMWDNLGRMVGEAAYVNRLWDPRIYDAAARFGHAKMLEAAGTGAPVTLKTDRLEIRGVENYVRLLTHEGPAILYTAHMGNWELLPVVASRFGVYSSVVFRRQNNPYVNRLVERMRAGMVSLLPKGIEGAIASAAVMEQGGRLGLLVDQKQNRGIAIPFFGASAMTGVTLARLALRYGSPIFGAYVERTGGSRFRITVQPALEVDLTGDDEVDVERIMRCVNEDVERWVRSNPGQWLWLHRRWPKEAVPS